MTFWLVGCKGLLAKAFQKVLQEASLSYRVSSREECDITNPEEIERFASGQGIKYCINCSAYTAVDLAETHPEEALALNKQGVLHLGSFAGKEGIKMVHFSTDYVFNGTKKRPYTEEDLADPLSVYGKS
ncbi:MAG: sugar nucleotide-binding protein, partial [Chlamydiae bacterium]|nr:sugar nucleotide-binding protein [Chlamydiota bacterium]